MLYIILAYSALNVTSCNIIQYDDHAPVYKQMTIPDLLCHNKAEVSMHTNPLLSLLILFSLQGINVNCG